MPRSCPPLRSDEVGWHGRRVRTRLRLILERVFWFVNGSLSRVFVGGMAVPRPAPGFRPRIGVRGDVPAPERRIGGGLRRSAERRFGAAWFVVEIPDRGWG